MLATVGSLMLPDVYTAASTFLPPLPDQSVGKALMAQTESLTGLPESGLAVASPRDLSIWADPIDLSISMLKSRSVQDAIVKEFDLKRVYSVTTYDKARELLNRRGEILAGKEGQISVQVSDRDPNRAAQIANAYVEQLQVLNQTLDHSEASQRRTFYENELANEQKALTTAEQSLRKTQEKSGLVEPESQLRAVVNAISTVRAQIRVGEAKLESMRTYAAPNNPDLQRTEAQLAGLREQLATLEHGTGDVGDGNVEIPTLQLPQAQRKNVDAARDLKHQEALYGFLNEQAEVARLDEAKPTALVRVIDEAIVPRQESGPHRLTIVLVSTALGFLLCSLWITTAESLRRRKDEMLDSPGRIEPADASKPGRNPSDITDVLAVPGSVIEVLALSAFLGLGILCFELGFLSTLQAAAGTALFLCCLDALAWRHFDQGRHPCFLFLCALTVLQGGRALAYLLGAGNYPLRVAGMAPHPFDLTSAEGGEVLLCIVLSALCIYGVCRWNYRKISQPTDAPVVRYLPFLYLVFYASLPIQLYKMYSYYRFVQQHGGYLYLWSHHGNIVSTVPLFVRAIVLINAPAFLAIFVFETRKKWVYLATISYFTTTAFTLLIGYRAAAFTLVLSLWYVARIKSSKRSNLVKISVFALALVVIGGLVQTSRESDSSLSDYAFAPLEFLRLQGNSIDVTSVAVKYHDIFAPFAWSYAWYDLQDAFVYRGVQGYVQGERLPNDVSVFLNPVAFRRGLGVGGSYLAEIYLLGGVAGVFALSLMLGGGLHLLHRYSQYPKSLFVVASVMPMVMYMPRGQLLDWATDLLKTLLSVAILWGGWMTYCTFVWLFRASSAGSGPSVTEEQSPPSPSVSVQEKQSPAN